MAVVVSRIRRAYVAIFYGQKQGRNQSCFTMFSRLSRFSIKDADHYYEAKARCGMRAPEHDELRKGRNPYLNYIILR